MTDHTRVLCSTQLPAITLVLCSVWAFIAVKWHDNVKPNTHTYFHIPFGSLSACVLLSGAHQCQLSLGSVSKRAEPFHKPVGSGRDQKVIQQFRLPHIEHTQMLSTLNTSAINRPYMQPGEGIKQLDTCGARMLQSYITFQPLKESWCCWDCCFCVWRGRPTCTAPLQRCFISHISLLRSRFYCSAHTGLDCTV